MHYIPYPSWISPEIIKDLSLQTLAVALAGINLIAVAVFNFSRRRAAAVHAKPARPSKSQKSGFPVSKPSLVYLAISTVVLVLAAVLLPPVVLHPPFRWYGLMYLFAFATTYILFMWQIKKRQISVPADLVMNLFFWAIFGLIIGARLFSVLVYDFNGQYLSQPWLIFWPFQDGQFTGLMGMSYHGGVIGAVVAIVTYTRVKRIDTLDWGDMMVQAIPLGYTFGRLGNFINGELYGKVTDSPIGMLFPTAKELPINLPWVVDIANRVGITIPDGATFINLPRFPSQLFEAFFEGIVLWLILWFVSRLHKPFKGFSIGLYMIGYGVFRFFIEYFREPDTNLGYRIMFGPKDNPPELFESLLNFSTGQILNALMILGGAAALLVFHNLAKRRITAESFDAEANLADEAAAERKRQRRKTRKKIK